jgi:hypothetical protein
MSPLGLLRPQYLGVVVGGPSGKGASMNSYFAQSSGSGGGPYWEYTLTKLPDTSCAIGLCNVNATYAGVAGGAGGCVMRPDGTISWEDYINGVTSRHYTQMAYSEGDTVALSVDLQGTYPAVATYSIRNNAIIEPFILPPGSYVSCVIFGGGINIMKANFGTNPFLGASVFFGGTEPDGWPTTPTMV